MPRATPASILSSPDRRSWPASGWLVKVADRASAVVVFMVQGCRRRWPPSIGIALVGTLVRTLDGIRIIPDRGQRRPRGRCPAWGLAERAGAVSRARICAAAAAACIVTGAVISAVNGRARGATRWVAALPASCGWASATSTAPSWSTLSSPGWPTAACRTVPSRSMLCRTRFTWGSTPRRWRR